MGSNVRTAPENLNILSSTTDKFAVAQTSGDWVDESITEVMQAIYARDGGRTGGHFAEIQPLLVEGDLQQAADLIPLPYKTGHAGMTKQRVGPITLANGLTFAMTDTGLEPIWQGITQDKSPSYVTLGRVLGSSVDVVAANGDLTTSSLTIADGLSGQSQDLEVTVHITNGRLNKQTGVTSTNVADDATVNSLTYKGDVTTLPTATAANWLVLLTANNKPVGFYLSTGSDPYPYGEVNATTALGSTGVFLGPNVDGAAAGSDNVLDIDSAQAYFDADSTRYDNGNTYYMFNGRRLVTLTITVATGTDDGQITVTGTDSAGNSATHDFDYTDNTQLRSVLSSTTKFATVVSAAPTGFAAGTVQITATPYTTRGTGAFPAELTILDGVSVKNGKLPIENDLTTTEYPVLLTAETNNAGRVAEGKLSASLTVTGEDNNGDVLKETLTFSGSGRLSSRTSLNYFARITEIEDKNFIDDTEITLKAQDKATEESFEPQDSELIVLFDAEYVKGNVPFTYRGLFINDIGISAGHTDPVQITCGIMGRDASLYSNIAGGADESDFSVLESADPNIFIGYNASLKVGEVAVGLINTTLNINNNFAYNALINNSQTEVAKPYRSDKRSVTCDGEIVFTKENNIAQDYIDNATYQDVVLEFNENSKGTFPSQVRVELDETQISAVGDPSSPEFDRITQPFNLVAFSSEFTNATDYRIVVTTPKPQFVRQYS